MLEIIGFSNKFKELTKDWDWKVEGFLDTNGYVHPIDSDTKVISTVFERLSSPVIRTIASSEDYTVEVANQTTYPDFTLSKKGKDGSLEHRIAIDIKTTYSQREMLFTLGGYNSFLRNDAKNILYPYSTYNEHWIIGFIYNRENLFDEYDLDSMPKAGAIQCSYSLNTFFIREKSSITGLRAGSGNTKNIGSVKVKNAQVFHSVQGPFTNFNNPKKACDKYWRNYDRYKNEINNLADLLAHTDFADE